MSGSGTEGSAVRHRHDARLRPSYSPDDSIQPRLSNLILTTISGRFLRDDEIADTQFTSHAGMSHARMAHEKEVAAGAPLSYGQLRPEAIP